MNSTAPLAQQTSCVQLKGSLLPLTVLELLYFDAAQLSAELAEKAAQAPEFFKDLPVVIGLSKFDDTNGTVNFEALIDICKTLSIKPVAVRGGSEAQQVAAKLAGLAHMAAQKERSQPAADTAPIEASVVTETADEPELAEQQSAEEPETSTTESGKTAAPSESPTTNEAKPQTSRIIYQPVRSGQQIYAQNGDLIVLAQVSAGAEILADGNIHVYGPLRGRALAGVRGNTEARIFCQSLEAELVSIAGQYKISEDLQNGNWKKPAQIHLSDEKLTVKPLVD